MVNKNFTFRQKIEFYCIHKTTETLLHCHYISRKCHFDVLMLAFVQAFNNLGICVTVHLEQLCY